MALAVSVPRDDLAEKVGAVARALPSRSVVQVLNGILLRAEGDRLTLTATDGDLAVRDSLPTIALGEGDALVPGKLLAEIARALPAGNVSLELDGTALKVEAGRASYRLAALDPDDFPRVATAEDLLGSAEGEPHVDRAAFLGAVARVSGSASTDASRPVLTGVLVRLAEGRLTVAATDSYRLSVFETELGGEAELGAIVPARALAEASRLDGEKLRIVSNGNRVLFAAGEAEVSARLIYGEFPNYEQLVPEVFEHELALDRPALVDAVRRALVVADGTPVRLAFRPGEIEVGVVGGAGESTETLPSPFAGEPVEVGFNARYLLAGLEAFPEDEVRLRMISPLRPVVLDAGALTYLIMPQRLPS